MSCSDEMLKLKEKVEEILRRNRSEDNLIRCRNDRDDNSGMSLTRSRNESVGESEDRSCEVNTITKVRRSRESNKDADEEDEVRSSAGEEVQEEEFSVMSDQGEERGSTQLSDGMMCEAPETYRTAHATLPYKQSVEGWTSDKLSRGTHTNSHQVPAGDSREGRDDERIDREEWRMLRMLAEAASSRTSSWPQPSNTSEIKDKYYNTDLYSTSDATIHGSSRILCPARNNSTNRATTGVKYRDSGSDLPNDMTSDSKRINFPSYHRKWSGSGEVNRVNNSDPSHDRHLASPVSMGITTFLNHSILYYFYFL